jgi:PAS domain S-box-containing protein
MLTPIALLIATLLQVIAAIIALNLIRVTKGKLSWILISSGLLLMAVRRVIEFLPFVSDEPWKNIMYVDSWLGVTISLLIITGVILIGEIFYSWKRAERVQLESERKFKTLFNSSSDGIYALDFDGHLIEVNQVICDVLGYSKEELMNMHLTDIKSSKCAELIPSIVNEIKNKEQLIFESEHRTKDGKIIPVEIKSRVIDYNSQKAILSMARDITERKQTERKILNAIIETEEKEKERFAKDLHDGLGTLLSSINIYVNMLKSPDLDKEEMGNILNYTKGLIGEAIHNTREIANNLKPDVITRFGLTSAIKSHCEMINTTGLVTVDYRFGPDFGKLNEDVEVTVFRVIKELINNTLKHASANKVEINLDYKNKVLTLDYSDNGIGFDVDKELKEKNHKGMGLSNIMSRIKAVNGTCKIYSKKGKGARVLIQIKTG